MSIRIFQHPEFGEVRTSINSTGEPVFCLVDVCNMLRISNPGNIKKRLNLKGIITIDIPIRNNSHGSATGNTKTKQLDFITEPNLYKCISQSRKEETETVKDWFFEDVLPSTRRTCSVGEPPNTSGKIQIFNEQEVLGKKFRIYGTINEPLFLAKDVAEWIDYSKDGKGNFNVSKMLMSVDDDEKIRLFINLTNSKVGSNTWFLTEDGLFEVLMQSRKPIAKQFKKKVKEILKTIRRHGAYMTPQTIDDIIENPDVIIRLVTELKEEREKHKASIHRERDMSTSWLNIACDQIQELNEAYETAQMYEILARRYFFLTQGYRKLALENNIRIPAKLKMTKYNYEADLKRLKNGK